MEITSVNNEKIKYLEKQKKYRDLEKMFLVEDEHLVLEALKAGYVKEIYTTNGNSHYEVPTYVVTDKIMKLISNQVTSSKIIALCYQMEEKNYDGNIIILDNLQDPGNLGTIIRSAVAFNFNTIVLSNDSVDGYNPKVVRSSEGMLFHINIIRTNLEEFLDNLDNTYTKITTDVKNGQNIKDIHLKKCAIVIGNEGNGVSKKIQDKCEVKVNLKMNNNCESLNAGVAASILMYEVFNG